jgi:hypothetical protein
LPVAGQRKGLGGDDWVVPSALAHEGEAARLFIGAELADAVHGLLDGFVGNGDPGA